MSTMCFSSENSQICKDVAEEAPQQQIYCSIQRTSNSTQSDDMSFPLRLSALCASDGVQLQSEFAG
ncbi:hypothetical protein KIN20_025743 [Parelaphostrongylus tenuis]|uniref:Uncharacterized protein n=1 Tax=Parelaphostrongylus tenuis TaxID=148309 RepID=A0AAD5QXD4_PARTN|nr:hypothetical protein KIN20_025743 [Parelaphostrongylus tenuis]